jgi:hypothetical protein
MLRNDMDCTDIMTLAGEGTVGQIGPHIFYLTFATLEPAPEPLLLQFCTVLYSSKVKKEFDFVSNCVVTKIKIVQMINSENGSKHNRNLDEYRLIFVFLSDHFNFSFRI